MVSHLLRLSLCATEYDSIDARIVVNYTLEGEILILGIYEIIDMVHVL
jgi:hypothetical protein